jgi:hypothetical protein
MWQKSVESDAAGVRVGETQEQPYRHTAIWRFANSCRRSGAIRARSRNFMRYADQEAGAILIIVIAA